MKLLTANLTERALDWALAKALEYEPQVQFDHVFVPALKRGWPISGVVPFDHTDPALCLGLMEQYRINIDQIERSPGVEATIWHEVGIMGGIAVRMYQQVGKTLAEAVARCVVAMQLGDEVEVPDELCGVDHG